MQCAILMSNDSARAVTYPTQTQYERWKDRANGMDMSTSESMQAMIEAGNKKFDATLEPDETHRELRHQRNDLKDQLDRARSRVQELEEQLHRSEHEAVREYVENNPGAEFQDIVQHIVETVPERVNRHLEDLEGEALGVRDGAHHLDLGEDDEGL